MSGDGGHVHTVNLPYGRVAAVEVAAVGAGGHIVWTFMFGAFPVNRETSFQLSTLNMNIITLASFL